MNYLACGFPGGFNISWTAVALILSILLAIGMAVTGLVGRVLGWALEVRTWKVLGVQALALLAGGAVLWQMGMRWEGPALLAFWGAASSAVLMAMLCLIGLLKKRRKAGEFESFRSLKLTDRPVIEEAEAI